MRKRSLLASSYLERCLLTSLVPSSQRCSHARSLSSVRGISQPICQYVIISSGLLRVENASRVIRSTGLRKCQHTTGAARPISHVRTELEHWRDDNSGNAINWNEALFNAQVKTELDNNHVKADPMQAPNTDDDEIEAQNEMVSLLDRLIDESDADSISAPLANVGDFVDIKIHANETRCGIFLGTVGPYAATFLVNGKLFLHPSHRINFVLPKFASKRELADVFKHLPKSKIGLDTDFKRIRDEFGLNIEDIIPYEIGWRLRRKLLLFIKDSDALYRQYARLFDTMHERLAADDRSLLITPSKITSILWGRRNKDASPAFEFAAYRVAKNTLGLTYSDSGRLASEMVEVYSKKDADLFKWILSYARAYTDEKALVERGQEVPSRILTNSEPLKAFVRMYQRLRDYSRPQMIHYQSSNIDEIATPVAFSDPLTEPEKITAQPNFKEFGKTDQMFIRFLLLQSLKSTFGNDVALQSAYNTILRACEPNANQFDAPLARNLLVYMGVIAPAQPFIPFDMHVHNLRTETLDAVGQMETRAAKGEGVEDSFNLHQDRMLGIRRNWGDLIAFVIDADHVSVFDDAISFEHIPNRPNECWFRVHIAEPTAFIDPASELAKLAKGRNKALYLASGRISMFPDVITEKFSLCPGKAVMTYSAKLCRSGRVLETTIEPGYISNTVHCSPDTINSVIFETKSENVEHTLFGAGRTLYEQENIQTEPVHGRTHDVNQYSDTFREAFTFIEAWRNGRGEESYPSKHGSRMVNVRGEDPGTHGTNLDSLQTSPTFSFASHDIEIKNIVGDSQRMPANQLVEGAAHLANAIAGEWCARRNIPVPFHGLVQRFGGLQADDYSALRDAARRASTNSFADSEKYWRLRARLMALVGVRTISTEPVPHMVLKDPHRTRITNPLRSYIDLVSTWQIESALLEEHRRKKSLVGRPANDDSSFLVFPRRKLRDIIDEHKYLDNYSRLFQAKHTQALQFNAIARAIATDDPRFPKRLTAVVSNISKRGNASQSVRARIQELDISAVGVDRVSGDDGNLICMDDVWEVKITSVPAIPQKDISISFVRRLHPASRVGLDPYLTCTKSGDAGETATA